MHACRTSRFETSPTRARALVRRAALAGQSLQQYLAAQLTALAATPTLDEMLDRIAQRPKGRLSQRDAIAAVEDERARRTRRCSLPQSLTAVATVTRVATDFAARLSRVPTCHVEVISAIRRQTANAVLTVEQADRAIDDLLDLPLAIYPSAPLLHRGWALRNNLTAYDACYAALAEALGCPLLTADLRLAHAAGVRCDIELV